MSKRSIYLGVLLIMVILFAGELAFADGPLGKEGERLSRTCAGCHGTAGASPGKLIPIIGGQLQGYTANVLQEFASESRPGTVMWKLAKGFSIDDQKQIASYFAAQTWVVSPHASADKADVSLLKSCRGCHGKNGEGRGAFPRLAGQHPEYLAQALTEYQKGQRKSSMMMLVKGMNEATLQQLADNYAAMK